MCGRVEGRRLLGQYDDFTLVLVMEYINSAHLFSFTVSVSKSVTSSLRNIKLFCTAGVSEGGRHANNVKT